MRFVIWSPNYADRSAGISALHRLCHWLTVLGHDASLTCNVLNPDWETRYFENVMTEDTIAVYPEIIADNPLNARKVVRWALSHPGFHYFGSPTPLGPCDLAFYYADRFRESTQAAYSGMARRLFVSVYPGDVFFPWDGPRTHDMFYVGRGRPTYEKYRNHVDLSKAIEFPGNFPNRFELGKALRRVNRFFCFDQVTALLAESMLCGAQAVFIREDGQVIPCDPSSLESMGVFGSHARYDKPGDVESFVRLVAQL